jgi:hypothetical protein
MTGRIRAVAGDDLTRDETCRGATEAQSEVLDVGAKAPQAQRVRVLGVTVAVSDGFGISRAPSTPQIALPIPVAPPVTRADLTFPVMRDEDAPIHAP